MVASSSSTLTPLFKSVSSSITFSSSSSTQLDGPFDASDFFDGNTPKDDIIKAVEASLEKKIQNAAKLLMEFAKFVKNNYRSSV